MPESIKAFVRKVKAVATSVVTKLALVGAVLTTVATLAAPYAAVPVVGAALPYLAVAIGVVATLTAIVRKVSEVPDDLVGLEPATALDRAVSFGNAAAVDEAFWGDAA
jgi:hypothetical protein